MNEPRLRFNGFSEKWATKKIKNLSNSTFGGGTPSTKNQEFWSGNIPWMSSSDLMENNLNDVKHNHYINKYAIRNSATHLIPKNSIAIVTRVGVGKLALIQNEFSTSQDFISLSDLNENPTFLVRSLYLIIKKEKQKLQGTSIKGITKSFLLNLKIKVPKSRIEQQKIGSFFEKLDQLIQLQSDKLEHLKMTKKGYLQKMFPEVDSFIPQIRFDKFYNAWKKEKLCNLVNINTGYPFKSNNFSKDGKYLVITNSNIQKNNEYVIDKIGNRININDDKIIKKYKLSNNEILITMDGNVGRSAKVNLINESNMILAQRVARIISKNYDYFYTILNTNKFINNIINKSHGGTIKHISLNDISSSVINIPNIDEQQKIGQFFSNLDQQITLQQQKLDNLKQQKKAYLQKMFI